MYRPVCLSVTFKEPHLCLKQFIPFVLAIADNANKRSAANEQMIRWVRSTKYVEIEISYLYIEFAHT